MQQQWSAVDNFMISSLIPDDDVLDQVLENNKRAGLAQSGWRAPCRLTES